MRNLFLTGILLAFAVTAGFSQDCKVSIQGISRSYTGDCKGGKAEGKGKAVGIDTYEGDFKSGYPDGTGTYSWKEGSWFTGTWKKGMREGKGEMHYKTTSGGDSTITGFWKRDVYLGKYEKPYEVVKQSGKVSNIKVNFSASREPILTLNITNTTGGTTAITSGGSADMPKLKLGEIDISRGSFQNRSSMDISARETKTVLKGLEFPFRAIFRVEDHFFEIEFFEAGNYSVDVNILQ